MGDRVFKSPNYHSWLWRGDLFKIKNEEFIRTITQRDVGIEIQNISRRKR